MSARDLARAGCVALLVWAICILGALAAVTVR